MDTSDQALVNTQASKRPRRMRSNEEKRRIVAETMAPGASLAAVAFKHGVNANLLFSWRRLHQRGLLAQSREPAQLLPVAVTAPSAPSQQPRPVKRVGRSEISHSQAGSIEIELPGRAVIRLHAQIDPMVLEAVLSALRAG